MSLIEEKKKLQCEELMLDGLNCPVCAAKIVKKVERIAGVDGVDYNTVTGILNIKSSYKSDYSIKNRVQEVVDGIEPGVIVRMRNGKNMESQKHRTSQSEKKYEEKIKDKHKHHSNTPFKNKYIRRLGIGSLFFVIALISEFIPADLILLPRWLILILFVSS